MEKEKSGDTGDNRSPLRSDNGVKQLQSKRLRVIGIVIQLKVKSTTYGF